MNPTLIIGLGGAGAEAVCWAKRQLEEDGCRWPAYLAIDSDGMDLDRTSAGNTRLNGDEICDIASPHLGVLLRNPMLIPEPHLREAAEGLGNMYLSPMYGAGAVRRLGRFMLLNSVYTVGEKIRRAAERSCEAIRKENGALTMDEMDVFIIAGACGGTGSGALIDAAYLTDAVIRGSMGMRTRIHGFLLMPEPDWLRLNIPYWQVMIPNAWAALKDLEYWMDARGCRRFRQPYTHEITVDTEQPPFDECFVVFGDGSRGIYSEHDRRRYGANFRGMYGEGAGTAADMIWSIAGVTRLYHGGMMSLRRTERGLDAKMFGESDVPAQFREAYEKAAEEYGSMRLWQEEPESEPEVCQPEPEPDPEPQPEPVSEQEEIRFFAECLFYGLYKKIPPKLYQLDGGNEGVKSFMLMGLSDYALAPAKDNYYAMFRKFNTLPDEQKAVMQKLVDIRAKKVENEVMNGDLDNYSRYITGIQAADEAVAKRMSEIRMDATCSHPEIYEFYDKLREEFGYWLNE